MMNDHDRNKQETPDTRERVFFTPATDSNQLRVSAATILWSKSNICFDREAADRTKDAATNRSAVR